MTHKDKELVFALRKCWAKHPELLLAATRIEKLNAKIEEWRKRHDNLLQSALEQARKDAMRRAELEAALRDVVESDPGSYEATMARAALGETNE